MTLKGETVLSGGSSICDCGVKLSFKVCRSQAGFYVGTWCDVCGPWSRESHYFQSREEAEAALTDYQKTGNEFVMRDTNHHGPESDS